MSVGMIETFALILLSYHDSRTGFAFEYNFSQCCWKVILSWTRETFFFWNDREDFLAIVDLAMLKIFFGNVNYIVKDLREFDPIAESNLLWELLVHIFLLNTFVRPCPTKQRVSCKADKFRL